MYWSDGGAVARNCTCMMRDGCFYSHYCRLPCFTPAYTKVQCKTETRDSVVCPKVCANDETKLTTRTSDSQQVTRLPRRRRTITPKRLRHFRKKPNENKSYNTIAWCCCTTALKVERSCHIVIYSHTQARVFRVHLYTKLGLPGKESRAIRS